MFVHHQSVVRDALDFQLCDSFLGNAPMFGYSTNEIHGFLMTFRGVMDGGWK